LNCLLPAAMCKHTKERDDSKHQSQCSHCALRARHAFRWFAVHAVGVYVLWVLVGVVAFISHFGNQVPCVAPWLPAGGHPRRDIPSASTISEFLYHNIPVSILFVFPHSVLRPNKLALLLSKVKLESYDRILYNAIAAMSLHFLMRALQPLNTPVVMRLPIPSSLHAAISGGCLIFAGASASTDPGTAVLLGIPRALNTRASATIPHGMDAITWMGECVWRRGGAIAFVLFTGLSILPPELTLGDALTRGVAALYLRLRSAAFRQWIKKIKGLHHFTWILRAILLTVTLCTADRASLVSMLLDWRVQLALLLAVVLHFAESYRVKFAL